MVHLYVYNYMTYNKLINDGQKKYGCMIDSVVYARSTAYIS